MAKLSKDEREILEATVFAQKSLMKLLAATIDLAVATGGRAETKNERAAYKALERIVAGVGSVLHAAGDLVRGDAGAKTDSEWLWRIHDQNLRRDFDATVAAVKSIGDVWFTERAAARDGEAHYCALKTAEWVSHDLQVPVPRIRWFSESIGTADAKSFRDSPGTIGKADLDGSVWVHASADVRTAISVVSHELRHVKQFRDGQMDGHNLAAMEDDAYSYAHVTTMRLHGKYGHASQMWREMARQARGPKHYTPPMAT